MRRASARVSHMSKITTTIYIERDEVELEVVVTGDYSAGCAGVMTLRNGDPGYPEEPEEINDITAHSAVNSEEIELTEKEAETAERELFKVRAYREEPEY